MPDERTTVRVQPILNGYTRTAYIKVSVRYMCDHVAWVFARVGGPGHGSFRRGC